jgi:hypothetical protein
VNDKIRAIQAEAATRLLAYESLPDLTGPAMPGDVYVVPTLKTGVNLMVVYPHPDHDHALFVVPADWIVELLGDTDVWVPEEFWGGETLVLRCGCGVWVERTALEEKCKRAKIRLPEQTVKEVRKVLHDMVGGELLRRGPDEDDPDLWDWAEEVEHDVEDGVASLDAGT